MISWRILAPLMTALGAIPLFAFAYYAPNSTHPLYLFGYFYVSMVIAFIAGIDWIIAIEEQKGWFLLWSILLSILPIAIMAGFVLLQYDSKLLWGQFLMLIWLSLLIDWRFFNKVGVSYYLIFRLSGTVVLTIAILICLTHAN